MFVKDGPAHVGYQLKEMTDRRDRAVVFNTGSSTSVSSPRMVAAWVVQTPVQVSPRGAEGTEGAIAMAAGPFLRDVDRSDYIAC